MTKEREALEMCLEYIEKNALERRFVRWAIKEALAQPEQEPLAGKGKELSEQLKHCARNVAFVAAGWVDMSSAAMQEMFALIDHVCVGIDSPPLPVQTEQEPVARVIDNGTPEGATEWIPFASRVEPLKTGDLLYTSPPQRPWVGLTEDEISSCDPYEEIWDLFKIARKLEAKLKEKNA